MPKTKKKPVKRKKEFYMWTYENYRKKGSWLYLFYKTEQAAIEHNWRDLEIIKVKITEV